MLHKISDNGYMGLKYVHILNRLPVHISVLNNGNVA